MKNKHKLSFQGDNQLCWYGSVNRRSKGWVKHNIKGFWDMIWANALVLINNTTGKLYGFTLRKEELVSFVFTFGIPAVSSLYIRNYTKFVSKNPSTSRYHPSEICCIKKVWQADRTIKSKRKKVSSLQSQKKSSKPSAVEEEEEEEVESSEEEVEPSAVGVLGDRKRRRRRRRNRQLANKKQKTNVVEESKESEETAMDIELRGNICFAISTLSRCVRMSGSGNITKVALIGVLRENGNDWLTAEALDGALTRLAESKREFQWMTLDILALRISSRHVRKQLFMTN